MQRDRELRKDRRRRDLKIQFVAFRRPPRYRKKQKQNEANGTLLKEAAPHSGHGQTLLQLVSINLDYILDIAGRSDAPVLQQDAAIAPDVQEIDVVGCQNE